MKTAIYLRKSRADEEAERKGEYETLSRHRSTLLKVAKDKNLDIVEIKEELVSGESISYRPKMLELLDEVKNGIYDAVLVMDIDRLGRGNMQDQGLILDTFKKSKTKIITPRKIYDLNNEFDEEYSEFEAFMARKELKLITRRMQRGRIKSVEEGKFIATSAPFGYKFEYIGKERKLIIDEEKAEIVKTIYNLYLQGEGAYKIADYLNKLGYRTTTGRPWYEKGIRDILKNKVYCGYVVWNRVERKRNSSKTRTEEEQIQVLGNHLPIIDENTWNKAQEIRKRRVIPPTPNKVLTNPLAGIVKCKSCGHCMTCNSATYKDEGYIKFLRCKNCKDNRGVKLYVIENEILKYIEDLLILLTDPLNESIIISNENSKLENYNRMLNNLEKESLTLAKQKENLHDFLEKGVYDVDTYLERSKILATKVEENKSAIYDIKEKLKHENEFNLSFKELIPTIQNIIDNYHSTDDATFKNRLLKSLIHEVIYYKEPQKRKAKFEIDIKLKTNI